MRAWTGRAGGRQKEGEIRVIQELLGFEIFLGIQVVGSAAGCEKVAWGMVDSLNSLSCFLNFCFVLSLR